MQKIIIVAASENNVIGKNGEIPWQIPTDLKHFKEKTLGHSVIMGRKTFESLPENHRPLPDRKNIVLTNSGLEKECKGVKEVNSLEEAYEEAEEYGEKVFIIGGSTVYEQTLDEADKLILTRVHEEYDGDAFFPDIGDEWKEEKRDYHGKFSFVEYKK